MHYLHSILVNITDDMNKMKRTDLISEIKSIAEDITDCYYEIAFDWRETDSAGRWSDIYPENVLLGSERPCEVIKRLKKCQFLQEEVVFSNLHFLKNIFKDDINNIIEEIWKYKLFKCKSGNNFGISSFLLNGISKILHGEYFYDSFFYDTECFSASLDIETFRKVKQNPKEWALVLFDYHN